MPRNLVNLGAIAWSTWVLIYVFFFGIGEISEVPAPLAGIGTGLLTTLTVATVVVWTGHEVRAAAQKRDVALLTEIKAAIAGALDEALAAKRRPSRPSQYADDMAKLFDLASRVAAARKDARTEDVLTALESAGVDLAELELHMLIQGRKNGGGAIGS
jgi:hypothetical protein